MLSSFVLYDVQQYLQHTERYYTASVYYNRTRAYSKERLPSRVMSRTMAGGENPRPGGQFKTWHRCIVQELREFRATEGSTELAPLVFGFETVLWSTAAKKAGKWYRGGPRSSRMVHGEVARG